MKKITFILSLFVVFSLFIGQASFVEAGKGIKKNHHYIPTSRIGDPDSPWPQVLLEKDDVGLLPTSPFYFVKEWGRGIKKFFTFDPVKKAELELKYSDEKLVELEKVAQTTQRTEALQKALDNYLESQERLTKGLESLPQNKNTEELLNKLGERMILHQALFDEIVNEAPALEEVAREGGKTVGAGQITEIIKRLYSTTGQPTPVGEPAIQKLPYPEGVKEIKALEILTRLEENLPEEAKQGIKTAKEAIQKRLVEEGKIQSLESLNVIQQSEGWYSLNGVPVEKGAIEKVVEKLEEKAKEISPVTQRPNIVNVEAVKGLKEKLQEAQKVMDENAGETEGKVCPTIAPDTSKGKEECLKSAKALEVRYPGCNYSNACEKISEKPTLDCDPAPGAPGDWRCIDGVWKDVSQCGKIQCIRYDPVCGTDGKTYSCGEIDAKSCGVEVAYKGECKKQEYPGALPLPSEQPATSSESVPAQRLPQPILCTQEWNPVCGVDYKTYSNECMAKAAGVTIQYKGECKYEAPIPLTPN